MKKYLIAVDLQKDFVDGALGTKEAVAIVPAAVKEIEQAKKDGKTVVVTLDTHTEEYMNTSEGRHLPVVHCVKGTPGWQLDAAIEKAAAGAVRVEKPTFGSTALPALIEKISAGETPEIELIGLCTDICVVSNALILKAHFPEAKISVNAACCAGVTPEKHLAALETMRSCQIEVF